MKSDTCYYLDSLSSGNFNMQLKQIVDSRHWVLGVLDMKSDTCYYLDSLSSGNFNMQLKQIGNGSIHHTKWIQQKVSRSARIYRMWQLHYYNLYAMTSSLCPTIPEDIGYWGNGSVHHTKWIQQKVSSSTRIYRMKEIVEEGIKVLVKDNIGDGKAEYTTVDIDEIREEWSTFVTSFIYR
uniref:Ubiquitin-like protease family profile domain-containing protein n=1 Tax=Lactuca sativa TaxID=4236 RepID=A0A9R1VC05_LACSA|nr:hypothetical protein LSAT_V11C500263940 [Lactuca sativa]